MFTYTALTTRRGISKNSYHGSGYEGMVWQRLIESEETRETI